MKNILRSLFSSQSKPRLDGIGVLFGWLLIRLLRRYITDGELTVIDAYGQTHSVGNPGNGPCATIALHDPLLHAKLVFQPRLAFGEAYMDGSLTVENGSIYDVLDLHGLNTGTGPRSNVDRWLNKARHHWAKFGRANPLKQARKNASHHYDLSGELYDLFLDSENQYSCAYFKSPDMSLEAAQAAKKAHIAAKLLLLPGQKVLDIGSGWGNLAMYLAEVAKVDVSGIDLSTEHLEYSNRNAAERGLDDRVRFRLRDYREETGTYDRIVSVGMFEHVGLASYDDYFSKIAALLTRDGVALVHTISQMDEPYPTSPWIERYIFPGGYVPPLSEVLPAIERAGLWVTDIEILRLHYAETLKHWRSRFTSNWQKAAHLYDERFCRMWEFYLAACEMSFRREGRMVAQIQLAKSIDAVPLTRDYIGEWERAHAQARAA